MFNKHIQLCNLTPFYYAQSVQIEFFGPGLIAEIILGFLLLGGVTYGLCSGGGRPDETFVEKVRRLLAEEKVVLAGYTAAGVTALILLVHAGWHITHGTEPDYQQVARAIASMFGETKDEYWKKTHPHLQPFERHFFDTVEYINQEHVTGNKHLQLMRYLSFDPNRLHPVQLEAWYDVYVDQIGLLSRNVNFEDFLRYHAINEVHVRRFVEFLQAHPERAELYHKRLITFLEQKLTRV